MKRWSEKLGVSVNFALENVKEDTFLENFFTNRAYIPQTEEDKKEFQDFSFVSSAMALAIFVAAADGDINELEEERIVKEMLFQLEQYHKEYEVLSEKFSASDKIIITSLFEKFKSEILSEVFDIKTVINLINKIYALNPYKKNYLLRLSYIVAFTDSRDTNAEMKRVDEIAGLLQVDSKEQERIKKETLIEVQRLNKLS